MGKFLFLFEAWNIFNTSGTKLTLMVSGKIM